MVRSPCFDSNGMKKGAWSEEEDTKLRTHIEQYGHRRWRLVPIFAGLARCGKSCRLRWVNYLKPGRKRGNFTKLEEDQIKILHAQHGNKWSAISERMPGRTDNDVKNYWHAHIKNGNKSNKAMRKKSSSTSQEEGVSVENDKVVDGLNPIADPNTIDDEKEQRDSCSVEYETCYNRFNVNNWPLFTVEDQLHDFRLYQEIMQNGNPNFPDYSDTWISSWNSTEESQVNVWSHLLEHDTFDVVLW